MHPARSFLASLEQIGIKLGLDQIRALLEALGRPDQAFRSIVVAGTNGKGSTTAMIEHGLRAAGYRTGRYTSPHLLHIEERIAINGTDISTDAFDEAAVRVQTAASNLPAPPSFFEATTALALDVFRSERIDVAVLEVGLGGRLDATNAVAAGAAVITAVDFDHQQYLGHTLEAIAHEKAGVIKPLSLVVLAENSPVVTSVVHKAAAAVGATVFDAWRHVATEVQVLEGRARLSLRTPTRTYAPLLLGLRGRHQVPNALAAIRLLEAVDGAGLFTIHEAAIRQAVEDVAWPARLEMRRYQGHAVLIDGAHNPAGASALARYVAETYGTRVPMVVGVMEDKDLEGLAQALAQAASTVVCTAARSPRAATPDVVAAAFARMAPDVPILVVPDPLAALRTAIALGTPVVVAGSLYLVGEIRGNLS